MVLDQETLEGIVIFFARPDVCITVFATLFVLLITYWYMMSDQAKIEQSSTKSDIDSKVCTIYSLKYNIAEMFFCSRVRSQLTMEGGTGQVIPITRPCDAHLTNLRVLLYVIFEGFCYHDIKMEF